MNTRVKKKTSTSSDTTVTKLKKPVISFDTTSIYRHKVVSHQNTIVHLQNKTVHVENKTVHLQNKTAHMENKTVHVQNKIVHMENKTVHPQNKTVHIENKTVPKQNSTAALGNKSKTPTVQKSNSQDMKKILTVQQSNRLKVQKSICLLLAIVCIMPSLYSQKPSIVKGKWQRSKIEEVKLFSVENGKPNQIAAVRPQGAEGDFTIEFTPDKEGYYLLGLSSATSQNRYPFYFKAGDHLNLVITEKSYTLVGDNTEENREMARWHDFIYPLEDKAIYFAGKNSTYQDFFPLLESKLSELERYPVVITGNQVFNRSFENFTRNDLLSIALTFVQTPRSLHPKAGDFIDYYKKITIPSLTSTATLLDYPTGMNLLMQASMLVIQLDSNLTDQQRKQSYTDPLSLMLGPYSSAHIVNDTIKGELVLAMARNNRSTSGFIDYESRYGKYILTHNQSTRWDQLKHDFDQSITRSLAIDFTFVNLAGDRVSLSDFKGKVVYIDIWATWCGPCRREFPFMKKLEEDYRDTPGIIFMGVNTDVARNKQKWIDFLAKEQLPGVQLFAGDLATESLMNPYKISGIPRFILVDKTGRLIFANAPRPSSTEIKSILDSALKE